MGKVVCAEPDYRQRMRATDPRALLSYGARWYEDGTLLGWETFLAPEVVEQLAWTAALAGVTVRLTWQVVDEEYGGVPSDFWMVGLAVLSVDPVSHEMLVGLPDGGPPLTVATDRVYRMNVEIRDPKKPEKVESGSGRPC